MKSSKIRTKGHTKRWVYRHSDGPKRRMKKMARRDQRRDGHKEIATQLVACDDPVPGPNMFAPVPVWLMIEWERLGMEHFRLLKWYRWSNRPTDAEQERFQKVVSDCDEKLYENLQRSIKR